MDFNEYQVETRKFATYPGLGANMVYPAMGLAGEAGEACDKVKKFWRNLGTMNAADLTPEQHTELLKEIGDVLWYAANLAEELGYAFNTVAELNLHKLADRRARNVIKSEGDNR